MTADFSLAQQISDNDWMSFSKWQEKATINFESTLYISLNDERWRTAFPASLSLECWQGSCREFSSSFPLLSFLSKPSQYDGFTSCSIINEDKMNMFSDMHRLRDLLTKRANIIMQSWRKRHRCCKKLVGSSKGQVAKLVKHFANLL